MARFLITGGAGFIGAHIARRLVRDGHDVRILDNLSSGKLERLSDIRADVEFMQGDIREPGDCAKACKSVDVVYHQAALPSVPRSVESPAEFHVTNVDGTFNIFLAARDADCGRLVYASSSSVYGDQEESPKHEGMLPTPLSPYALNKLVGEYYARVFHESYGLACCSLRYFNVFGPHQDPHSQYAAAIPAFVSAMLNRQPPEIYGDGTQTRDFTHVDNVVEANLLAGQATNLQGQVFNIACGESISINQVVGAINKFLGTDLAPSYRPPRAGDVMHSCADVSRAQQHLGFEPAILFEEGLARAIEWYREHLA